MLYIIIFKTHGSLIRYAYKQGLIILALWVDNATIMEKGLPKQEKPLKPTRQLGAGYMTTAELNVQDRRVALALNLAGLGGLFLFGWFFSLAVAAIRPEISPGLGWLFSDANLLILIAGFIGVLILHELIHGLFFWLFTGVRPQFGFKVYYAYAAAPDWFLPRNQFLVVGLGPIVLISLAGLGLMTVVSDQLLPELLLLLILNAAGSVGDLAVVGWLLGQPATTYINDTGPRMTFYKPAPPIVAVMNPRWLKLMGALGVAEKPAQRLYADLVAHYTERSRHYHNLEHVADLLDTFDTLRDLAETPETVQLAIWFHDVIYNTRASDNESRSAAYARLHLAELGLAEEIVNRVSELILATLDHQAPTGDIDGQILLDADLAPLGVDETLFAEHSEALRREYAWVPEAIYRRSRARILQRFLDRERIYYTEPIYNSLEERARRNLSQAIAAYGQPKQ